MYITAIQLPILKVPQAKNIFSGTRAAELSPILASAGDATLRRSEAERGGADGEGHIKIIAIFVQVMGGNFSIGHLRSPRRRGGIEVTHTAAARGFGFKTNRIRGQSS